ncbi:MAG: hypothetical protein Kow00120_15900 [Anaerolineae bacterium]
MHTARRLRAWSTDTTNRQIVTVLGGHGLRLALGLVSSALLARGLGPQGLSLFSVVGATMMIAVTVADFGMNHSAVRFIAADRAAAPAQARQTVSVFARLKLLGALATFSIMIALSGPLAGLLNLPADSGPLLMFMAGLGLLATSLSGVLGTVLRALSRFGALVLTQLFTIALTILLVAALYTAGRLEVVSALAVGVAAALATAGLSYFLLPPSWRRAVRASARLNSAAGRRLLTFSRWLWVSATLSILLVQLDLLLLNRWMPPLAVGVYALALNLALKADVFNQSLHTVLLPSASALSGRSAYLAYLRRGLARSLAMALPLVLALPLARPFIIAVYGPAYAESVGVFHILMLVVLFDLLTTPVLLLAFPMDMPRLIAAADALRVLTLLGASAALIPVWGLYGAAIAKLAAKVAGAALIVIAVAVRLRRAPGQAAPAPDGGMATPGVRRTR